MATHEAGLTLVTDEQSDQAERGRELADRMDRLGVSGHKLNELSGVARDTITAARKGRATKRTYRRLEQALEDYGVELQRSPEVTEEDVDEAEFITVNLSGNFGITATVKGPVDRPEELQRMLSAILREMKGADPDPI